MPTPEWIDDLRRALDRQYGHSADAARVATLATVDRSGAPRARAVVCRRVDDEGKLYFVSDARSGKNEQLRGDPRAEVVFWLPALHTQYRLAGEAHLTAFGQDEPLRRELWRGLSDPSRALFYWPTPGIAVAVDETYPRAVSADVTPPANYEVLKVEPSQVERLNISSFPHKRRRWRADANWSGVDVNP